MLSPYHPCVIRKRKLVGNILIYRVRYCTWKRERERTDNNDGIVDKWENGKIGFVETEGLSIEFLFKLDYY